MGSSGCKLKCMQRYMPLKQLDTFICHGCQLKRMPTARKSASFYASAKIQREALKQQLMQITTASAHTTVATRCACHGFRECTPTPNPPKRWVQCLEDMDPWTSAILWHLWETCWRLHEGGDLQQRIPLSKFMKCINLESQGYKENMDAVFK